MISTIFHYSLRSMWQGEFGLEPSVYKCLQYIHLHSIWVSLGEFWTHKDDWKQFLAIPGHLTMLDDPHNQLNTHWTFQMALTIQIESSSLKSCAYSARPYFWSSLAMKHHQTGRSKSFSMAGRPWMEQEQWFYVFSASSRTSKTAGKDYARFFSHLYG